MYYTTAILSTWLFIIALPHVGAAEHASQATQPRVEQTRFELHDREVVVFLGGTCATMAQRDGSLETLLTAGYADRHLRFRNMAWQADTVYRQQRPLNFGGWDQQLERVDANLLICWFGQIEAMDGPARIPDFVSAYDKLLDLLLEHADRAVLVSPIRFEKTAVPLPDLTVHNRSVDQYCRAIGELAGRRGATYIDLSNAGDSTAERLTDNGLHLTPAGYRAVALCVARQIGIPTPPWPDLEPVRQAVLHKNELWHRYWRPMNWAFLAGDRTNVDFSRDAEHKERTLPEVIEQYLPRIEQADERICTATTVEPAIEPKPPSTTAIKGEHDAAGDLASFTLAAGYEINLFASEEDGIPNPVQMRWDADGRLYVLSTPLYPHIEPDEAPNDKVIVLEDTDGDGRADRSHVFADGLHMPEGLALGHGGLYVAHCTDLLHLSDTDGDGRADQRRVVLTGFGTGDTHQVINNLTWGPSGALYFCQGLHIFSRLETPWGIERLDAAGVWRLRPRPLRADPFIGNERPPHNPWGIVFDDWGQPTLWSGNGHGTRWLTPGLVRHSFRDDLSPVWNHQKTTSPEILGGSHLGDETNDIVVAGDYKSNAVLRLRFDYGDDQATLRLQDIEPLLVSSQRTFRPADIKVGPDGAIYVADWYNSIINHYGASYRHRDRDKTHGRIWRITATGRPLAIRPQLTGQPAPQLLEQLRSPERWTRRQARRLLDELPTDTLLPALKAWLERLDADDPQHEQLLLRAIGLYESHEVIAPQLLEKLANANDPRARAYAARVVGHWGDRMAQPWDMLERLVNDPNPRVRLEAVVACSYIRRPRAIEVAAMALDHPRNEYIDFALKHTVHELRDVWAPLAKAGGLPFDGNEQHLGYVLTTEGSQEMITVLENWSTLSSSRDALLAIAKVGDEKQLATVWNHPNADAAVMSELLATWQVRQVKPTGRLTPRLDDSLRHDDPALRAAAVRLAGAWGLRDYADRVRLLAENEAADRAVRLAAIESLPRLCSGDALEILNQLAATAPPDLWPAMIAALADTELTDAARHTATWINASAAEGATSELLTPLLRRRGGAAALAEAFRQTGLDRGAAGRCRQVLTGSGTHDPSLMLVVNQRLGLTAQPQTYDPEWVQELAGDVLSQGDAARGRKVYRSKILNCTGCHQIGGVGGDVGPDLSSVGRALPLDRILEEVLWPDRNIKEGFQAVNVFTFDGKIYQGIKVSEDASVLVLRDAIAHQDRRIATGNIETRSAAGTLMPSALTSGLPRRDLCDLFRYLSELDGY